MKIITAHQPAYLPWLGFFHKAALADTFVSLNAVQFEKNSFINRNKLKTANGEAWLTIPVEMKDHLQKKISEIRIDRKQNWRNKHWNFIFLNYKKANHFDKYADTLQTFYKTDVELLIDFIEPLSNFLFQELQITNEKLNLSALPINSTKQDLILDLCTYTNANAFVFGTLGKDYAMESAFREKNISIYFQEYKHPSYTQLWGEFKPYMSALDALFHLGAEQTKALVFENNITKEELTKLLR
jgi:hypothetical protein